MLFLLFSSSGRVVNLMIIGRIQSLHNSQIKLNCINIIMLYKLFLNIVIFFFQF